MKRFLYFQFFFLIVLIVNVNASIIEVFVKDSHYGSPISGAAVKLIQNGITVDTGTTDDGICTFTFVNASLPLNQQIPGNLQRENDLWIVHESAIIPEEIVQSHLSFQNSIKLTITNVTASVNIADSLALVELYNSTNGGNWSRNDNWLLGPVETWYGVTVENGRVTGIKLAGSLWFSYFGLSGIIPPEIGNLDSLKSLDLSSNYLTGTIPSEIGNLSNLTVLKLSYNHIEGEIPGTFNHLNKLQTLQIGNNKISGSIPNFYLNTPFLKSLWLNDNNLTGNIPAGIGTLNNLQNLVLRNNSLTGELPFEIGNLIQLTLLDIQGNQISGAIPGSIGNLINLSYLGLHRNKFTGEIPAELYSMPQVRYFYLGENQLSGQLPNDLYSLAILQYFSVNDNLLTGSLPIDIFQRASEIHVQGNYFSELADLENLQNLYMLYIHNNNFTFEDLEYNMDIKLIESHYEPNFVYSPQNKIGNNDSIILDYGQNYTLDVQCGGINNFYQWYKNGIILGNLSQESSLSLTYFDFVSNGSYYCQITNDSVPDLIIESKPVYLYVEETSEPCNMQDSLILVSLFNEYNGIGWQNDSNWLKTQVKDWYGISVYGGRVRGIELTSTSNFGLAGTLPEYLGLLDSLIVLDFTKNEFIGTIPQSYYCLSQLKKLHLGFNGLQGNIDSTIGNLTNLESLNLQHNNFNGEILNYITSLSDLTNLRLSGNEFSGQISSELSNLRNLNYLSLGDNLLEGHIPKELGNLKNLLLLELGTLKLTGNIPPELGNLYNLERLFIIQTKLTGNIPKELGQLKKIQVLILSENELTGGVPIEIFDKGETDSRMIFLQNNYLDSLPNIFDSPGLSLFVQNNNLTFEDLEYNMNLNSYFSRFVYYPQNFVGKKDTIFCTEGDTLKLSSYCGGSNNYYRWYKDSVIITELNTSDRYQKPHFSELDTGSYYVTVENPLVPGLILHSYPIQVRVNSDICNLMDLNYGWNIFSIPSYSIPKDIRELYQPLIDNASLMKIQDEQGNSLENLGIFGGWANNIGDITPTEGYKIKVNFDDSLSVCGMPVDYPFPIPLTAGWNIAGYPQQTEVDGMVVVQQLINKGTLIKVQGEAGNSIENLGIFGGWQNNIGNFLPGEGYKIKVASDDTLWISESYIKSTIMLPEPVATTHFIPVYEGNGVDHMNINLVELPANLIQPGDEFAVFNGNLCVGAITVLPYHLIKGTVSIAASAMDSYGMPGFAEGNEFTLKLWKAGQDMEYILVPDIISGTTWFDKDESTLASLGRYTVTGFDELFEEGEYNVKCYPNPFREEITIEIGLTNDSKVDVLVINQLGQRIKYLSENKHLVKGVHRLSWDGTNTGNGQVVPGIYYLKLEIDDEYVYRKIVLSK